VIPQEFLADLEAKPAALRDLAARLADGDPWDGLETLRPEVAAARRVVLVGMGSSAYAAGVVAARLRAAGLDAVAELASSDLLPAVHEGTLVVAVSAGGGSRETAAAVDRYRDQGPVVLLTNRPGSDLAAGCDLVVPMHAGQEAGGVACRSFQHTVLLLLALADRLQGNASGSPSGSATGRLARAAADASEDLLARRDAWLPGLRESLLGPDGTHVVAPARRLSSAQQSALMLREGPRRPAVACETGDWSHVDVYLTRTTDYRMLLLAGSRWEDELLRWTTERGSTVVAVGADVPGATAVLRYAGDGDDDVRLVSEVLVAELLAADAWLRP
jgi:fructoselysine-6-P-deglycase FrlB-like protein